MYLNMRNSSSALNTMQTMSVNALSSPLAARIARKPCCCMLARKKEGNRSKKLRRMQSKSKPKKPSQHKYLYC